MKCPDARGHNSFLYSIPSWPSKSHVTPARAKNIRSKILLDGTRVGESILFSSPSPAERRRGAPFVTGFQPLRTVRAAQLEIVPKAAPSVKMSSKDFCPEPLSRYHGSFNFVGLVHFTVLPKTPKIMHTAFSLRQKENTSSEFVWGNL